MTTRLRSLAFLVAVVAAIVTAAPPASAATTSINGVVLAPVGTWTYPWSANPVYDLHGVVVDGALGVATIRFVRLDECCNDVVLTASDGSQIRARRSNPPGTGAPVLAGVVTEPLTVIGGTGRFQGASGQGTFQGVQVVPVQALGAILPIALAPARVGTLTLQVTTP